MTSVFDTNTKEPMSGDIKLGTTGNEDIEIFNNKESTRFAFVFNKELWCFNQFDNSRIKVFSFRQNESDYIRDTYDQHDVKIINMDEDGNIDFLVYGYMNRGAYEGYVGIVLYRYYHLDNRIEELTYIPVNINYQFLKEIIGEFNYVNESDVFYFHLNDSIYAYNLTTKQMEEVVTGIDLNNFVFNQEGKYIAWEEYGGEDLPNKIVIYDLENQDKQEIKTEGSTVISLLGVIGKDLIYGVADTGDIVTNVEGRKEILMNKLIISNSEGDILKDYEGGQYYITGIEVETNVITVKRASKTTDEDQASVTPVWDDNILTNTDLSESDIELVEKDSDNSLKVMYITSSAFSEEIFYEYKETVNTIVTEDTTLRIDKGIEYPGKYIVYAKGDVKGIYEDAGEAIIEADQEVGLVFDLNQHKVWERGFTKSANEIEDIKLDEPVSLDNSFNACAEVLVKYKFNNVNIDNNTNGYDLLVDYFEDSYINLTGASLDQILYFVSEGRPVIVKTGPNNYGVIIGYNSNNISIFDPIAKSSRNINKETANSQFSQEGNVFISYSEEFE